MIFRAGTNGWRATAVVVVVLCCPAIGGAQLATPTRPAPAYENSAAFGLSYGVLKERDAEFWGWALDYSRVLGRKWFFGASLAWDEETERIASGPDKVVETYNFIATISYSLTRHLAITTGLAKGLADNDNPDGSLQFNHGDLATGIALGWTLAGPARSDRDSIAFSAAYEYNITENESSYSFDLTYGWSF